MGNRYKKAYEHLIRWGIPLWMPFWPSKNEGQARGPAPTTRYINKLIYMFIRFRGLLIIECDLRSTTYLFFGWNRFFLES